MRLDGWGERAAAADCVAGEGEPRGGKVVCAWTGGGEPRGGKGVCAWTGGGEPRGGKVMRLDGGRGPRGKKGTLCASMGGGGPRGVGIPVCHENRAHIHDLENDIFRLLLFFSGHLHHIAIVIIPAVSNPKIPKQKS